MVCTGGWKDSGMMNGSRGNLSTTFVRGSSQTKLESSGVYMGCYSHGLTSAWDGCEKVPEIHHRVQCGSQILSLLSRMWLCTNQPRLHFI